MNANRQIPFRWILPLAQLAICFALLWPLGAFIAFQLRGVAHEIWPTGVQQPIYVLNTTPTTVPPQPAPRSEDRDRSTSLVELRVQIPALLNFPCIFLGLLRIGPAAMLRDFWGAISFPIVGFFFWWLVGRGVEALAASRYCQLTPRIIVPEVLVAALLILGNGGVLFALSVASDVRDEFVYPWRLAAMAAALWVLCGAVIIAAKITQWRLRRNAQVFT